MSAPGRVRRWAPGGCGDTGDVTTLALSSPTPLDAFERREEWRFALLLLALVAAHGGTVTTEGSVVRKASGGRSSAAPPASAIAPRRGVRPPRSC